MTSRPFFLIFCILAATLLASCGDDGEKSTEVSLMSEEGNSRDANLTAPTTKQAVSEPAQNSAGVWHYICPKGCPGGGGSATPCPKCGTLLAHNQAYHGSVGNAGNTAPAINPASKNAVAPGANQPEPPQNAAGVWHYTCPNACAGGAGTAAICPKCGKQLEHNKAYHQ